MIDFAITTVARPQPYIHKLVACLRPDFAIRLIVGGPDGSYLDRYRHNSFLEIFAAPLAEWQQFEKCPVHQRAAWNYWRCLTVGAKTPGRQGLVVFEDDIILAPDWERQLPAGITEVEQMHLGPYVLSLYVAGCVGLAAPQHGSRIAVYPLDRFFGTQGMYYPESVRAGFAEFLKVHGVDTYRAPYDLLLKDYLKRANIPLFVTITCLVQHIGTVSTGLAGFHHQARHFHARLDAESVRNPERPQPNRAGLP